MQLILKYILMFCLLCSSTDVVAQKVKNNDKFSSSKNRQPAVSPESIAAELNYARRIFNDSINQALTLVESNLFLAIKLEYKKEEALAYDILGTFNRDLENYKLAITNFSKAEAIYLKLKAQSKLPMIYENIGDCQMAMQKTSAAIIAWKKGEKIAKNINANKTRVKLLIKIGNGLLKTEDFQKAKSYFDDALTLATKLDNQSAIVEATLGLGKVEELKGKENNAVSYYNSARTKAEDINSDELTNVSLNSLSDYYDNNANVEQGIEVKQQAYSFNTERGNVKSALKNSTDLANGYVELGQDKEAIDILNESAFLLDEEDNSIVKQNFYKTLSDVYEKSGNTRKANEVKLAYNTLIDSFITLEHQKKELILAKNDLVSSTQNRILLLEKDREINEKTIQLLQQDQTIRNEALKQQKIITYFLISGLIIIAVMAFFIYRNSKQKQMSNQLLTLKSLRNQMNPHFIFNSLNSVNGFIAQKDERSANKYLAEFSKLMREVLEYSQKDFIPLERELEILKLYLNLEHFRFKEHFDYSIDIEKGIDLDRYQIPPMLLQPFIENAIWHGLRYKTEKGKLEVKIIGRQDHVEIKIVDDGIGREQSKLVKTTNQKKMKSTGIKNVKNRLEIIKNVFQKELKITINDLDPKTKTGTEVKVELYV